MLELGGMVMAEVVPPHLCLLTERQLAARLCVKPATVAGWRRRHGLPVVKLGRMVRFRAGDVADWLGETRNHRAWYGCGVLAGSLRPGGDN